MGYLRGSEGAEFGGNMLESVRGNLMPAALTEIGMAWLMASKQHAGATNKGQAMPVWEEFGKSTLQPTGSHSDGREEHGVAMARVRDAEQAMSRQPNEAKHTYLAPLDQALGQAIGLPRHAQETTEAFGERIRDILATAERTVAGAAQGMRHQVGSALGAASSAGVSLAAAPQDATRQAKRSSLGALSQGGKAGGSLAALLTESPVLLGAFDLAAGGLLGALPPQAEQEKGVLGGIAGQARDTAIGLAQQGTDRSKAVAQAVMDKGQASADAHGLTGTKSAGDLVDAALSGALAGNAKAVTQDVLQTSDKAVGKEVALHGTGITGQPT